MVGDGVVNPFMWLPCLRRVCLYERAYSLLSLPPSGLGSSKLVCRPRLSPRYSSSCAELPLVVESYGPLTDIFPFSSILDAGFPIFYLHLANVLFDLFGSSL